MFSETVFSGFISKIINDCVDLSKNAIQKADSKRTSNLQTPESELYQVIIDVLNKMSYHQYNGQDILYTAAESILREFRQDKADKGKKITDALKSITSSAGDDAYEDFLNLLYHEISGNDRIYKLILPTPKSALKPCFVRVAP